MFFPAARGKHEPCNGRRLCQPVEKTARYEWAGVPRGACTAGWRRCVCGIREASGQGPGVRGEARGERIQIFKERNPPMEKKRCSCVFSSPVSIIRMNEFHPPGVRCPQGRDEPRCLICLSSSWQERGRFARTPIPCITANCTHSIHLSSHPSSTLCVSCMLFLYNARRGDQTDCP